ncbi:glutamate-5-semialdehyde dehydrogenase [Paenibacillus cymbidii]|uniref:glutamate-5-semialdehyde dehydrogenase n=1 Tax=Paenibacillus cymbidii TaxID=1639034 RepID=UPI0010813C38|nr:glutamate-5-semialdehyde dehydrogenase [Paenibacillus cymbidii]
MSEVKTKALAAKQSTTALARATTAQKNEALQLMADALVREQQSIIAANGDDIARGEAGGMTKSLLDRLKLDAGRIAGIAEGLRQIVALPDPIGDELEAYERPNGLHISKKRVPLGLIGIIYEARPNVTVDAAGLCLKSGNAALLRGGKDALSTNTRIVEVLQSALAASALPPDAIQLVASADRSSVDEMLRLNGLLDVVIPRGGAALIRNVVENATVPVIETGAGICHTFIDAGADPDMALRIAVNAKVQRPSVCNSMETLLVHRAFADEHLPAFAARFREANVELRGDAATRERVADVREATEADYATEYNDYILNLKIVDTIDEALAHIARYGTMHSECIVTENADNAAKFLQDVDAAAVYHNASTRFTDGFEFGFGAEIGISTQKLHARGPMGLPALTSTKYIVQGAGQIRA